MLEVNGCEKLLRYVVRVELTMHHFLVVICFRISSAQQSHL